MSARPHPPLHIGLMPLVDSAPCVVAEAAGYFAAEGLDVALSAERSWAALRDKLAAGRCQAAALLAPMPLAAALGLDPAPTAILNVMTMNQGGSAFAVSRALHARLLAQGASSGGSPLDWGEALARLVAAERGQAAPLTFAHVYPYSTHHYELRHWLARAGLAPERDVNLVTVPPPLMIEQLAAGRIDGAWVGSPWPALAAAQGHATVLFDKARFWPQGPEKVLAVSAGFAEQHPHTLVALLRALIRAGQWLDAPAHHAQAAGWLQDSLLPGVPAALLQAELAGLRFGGAEVQMSSRAQAEWLLGAMRRWRHLPEQALSESTLDCVALHHYRAAAASLGIDLPAAATAITPPMA